MRRNVETVLDQWCKAERKKLPEGIWTLIAQASFDLWSGPHHEEGYPGFIPATKAITKALEDYGDVWIDTDCDEVLTSEPQGYLEDENDPESWVEPYWESITHIERSDVLVHLVADKELLPYIQ